MSDANTAAPAPRRTSFAKSSPPTSPPERTAAAWSRAFRRSRTATCTSATPRRSASTSASPSEFGGYCNLRFDDTNPVKEDVEYVDSIKDDVRWLGFHWHEREYYASDYYEQLYQFAEDADPQGRRLRRLAVGRRDPRASRHADRARQGLAVPHAAASTRTSICSAACAPASSPTAPTCCARRSTCARRTSPCAIRCSTASATPIIIAPATRGASIRCTTSRIRCRMRSKASRIRSARSSTSTIGRSTTGRSSTPAPPARPRQYEFARLNLNYTVMSKRKLLQLVEQKHVTGWDDPRMPTVSGLRRRGYTPESIRDFCARVGVAKKENVIDVGLLEHCVREDLNRRAPRAMAVLRPLKLVLTNYPEGQSEEMDVANHPDDTSLGSTRSVPFSREIYIERDDFMEDPPKKFFRLAPGPRGAPAQRLSRHLHRGRSRTPPARSSSCAAPTIRRRAAATRPTAARSRRRCTGSRPRTRSMRKSGSTIGCSRRRIRKARPRRPAPTSPR